MTNCGGVVLGVRRLRWGQPLLANVTSRRSATTPQGCGRYNHPIITANAPSVHPMFTTPPVVETLLGVQFSPLRQFRSHHYGWYLREFLAASGWEFFGDARPLHTYTENFGSDYLQFKPHMATAESSPTVRMKVTRPGTGETAQVQPDKLYYSCKRSPESSDSYTEIAHEFAAIYESFARFTESAGLTPVSPDLWEVSYINRIPAGPLWDEVADWHRVLPSFFPAPGRSGVGAKLSTFDGTWHFDLADRMGRVHVRVAKMIMNQKPPPVLFVMLTARGRVGKDGVADWRGGLDLGHQACVQLFLDITSSEAHREWGLTT